MESYNFTEQHLIAAFRDNQFVGVLITYPNETVTVSDLQVYFGAASPTYFMVEKIPRPLVELGELTPENYKVVLAELIDSYMQGGEPLFYKPNVIHIPLTIH